MEGGWGWDHLLPIHPYLHNFTRVEVVQTWRAFRCWLSTAESRAGALIPYFIEKGGTKWDKYSYHIKGSLTERKGKSLGWRGRERGQNFADKTMGRMYKKEEREVEWVSSI